VNTPSRRREIVRVAALFMAITIVFTWPLVRGLAHDLPGDYGDPLLSVWILAWDTTHFGPGWWNANIFYPHPLALAYSEHSAAQALQVLPVYWLSGNPILCYNLLFLSTFVLSGIGAFLLARDITGDAGAATVAGIAFAFAPYRVASIPHLHVLSSAWMPFTLYGFRRYFETRRNVALAGAAGAWILQNLSCGYFLLYFAPIVLMYVVWELTARKLWTDTRVIASIAATAFVAGAITLPFLLPYAELRRLGFASRGLREVRRFSADVYGYLTADPGVRVFGSLVRAWPKAEGELFPGVTVTALAVYALARNIKTRTTAIILAAVAGLVLSLLFGYAIRLPGLKVTSLARVLTIAGLVAAGVLVTSRTRRHAFAEWMRTPCGFFVVVTAFAIVMSFGPEIRARDRVVLGTNLYGLFYAYVPGFDGLRVPARFGMIAALGFAMVAALAVASSRRRSFVVIAAALIVLESFPAPIAMNRNPPDYRRPGLARLPDLERVPAPVYGFVASLPGRSAIAELPLGEPAFDVRYMYYSIGHWHPLVNGYTGGLPQDYEMLDLALQDLFTRPVRAWQALRGSGASHVIVHESLYEGDRGPRVSEWLRASGAHEVAAFGPDRVFAMP
jgi:hypothetical protein